MTTDNRTFGTGNQDVGSFIDRRTQSEKDQSLGLDRRQFSDGHSDLSPEAAELGQAIDHYKLVNRRRYITYEETLAVIKSLGYSKS